MKKPAAIFIAALLAASLSACSEWEIEIRNPYDIISESSSKDSSEFFEESLSSASESESAESEPESDNTAEQKPERESKADSDFGIEPATAEETEEFVNSKEAMDDLFAFAAWVGEKDFESPKEVFSSYVLWWFSEEIFEAAGGEEALYENGQFFAVDVELAEKYFKRHFGMDEDDVADDYNSDGKFAKYKMPVSVGKAPTRYLSAQVSSVEENRVVYSVLILKGEDETGKTFVLTEITCDVLKDEEGFFLRLVSNEKGEEFGEVSFEDQAKYLTSRLVESLGTEYILSAIQSVDSKNVLNFISGIQKSIHLGKGFDRNSPYIGEFYKDGEGYHLPVSSIKTVAKEVFGIYNPVISKEENLLYDEEKDEYTAELDWQKEYDSIATDLTAYVNGDIYTVRFSLAVLEKNEDETEWIITDRYKMNFRLIGGKYLRFTGIEKA